MADRPDYFLPTAYAMQEVPAHSRLEWAGKELELKNFNSGGTQLTLAGVTTTIVIYDVPTDKRFLITDFIMWTDVAMDVKLEVKDEYVLYWGYSVADDVLIPPVSLPVPGTAGDRIWMLLYCATSEGYNWNLTGYEEPASNPRSPKNDSPDELFLTGDFNFCKVQLLPNGEIIYFFGKDKQKPKNYLRIKDPWKEERKILKQGKIEPHQDKILISQLKDPKKDPFPIVEWFEKKYVKPPKKFTLF